MFWQTYFSPQSVKYCNNSSTLILNKAIFDKEETARENAFYMYACYTCTSNRGQTGSLYMLTDVGQPECSHTEKDKETIKDTEQIAHKEHFNRPGLFTIYRNEWWLKSSLACRKWVGNDYSLFLLIEIKWNQ